MALRAWSHVCGDREPSWAAPSHSGRVWLSGGLAGSGPRCFSPTPNPPALLPVPSSGSKQLAGERAQGPLPKGLSSLHGQVRGAAESLLSVAEPEALQCSPTRRGNPGKVMHQSVKKTISELRASVHPPAQHPKAALRELGGVPELCLAQASTPLPVQKATGPRSRRDGTYLACRWLWSCSAWLFRRWNSSWMKSVRALRIST